MANVYEALEKTMADINDIVALAKSAGLAKAEDEDKMEKAEPGEEEMPAPAPAPEASGEMPPAAAEGEPAPESEMMGEEGAPEGEAGQEESAEQHAESMSDEELDMMLQILSQEKEKRAAAQAAPAEGAAPAPGEGSPEGQMQMSMKDDYAKMHKSMTEMSAQLAEVSKELAAVKNAPKSNGKVTTKAAASNHKDVQVLEKSSPVAKRLSKSETIEFLQGQIRKRHPAVSAMLVAEVNLANPEELTAIQDRLAIQGVDFPKK